MIVAGLMSGTSLDGIDVAIVEITGTGWNKRVQTIAHSTTPYPEEVRKALLGVSNTSTHTAQIAWLNFLLPELYAKCVQRLWRKSGAPKLDLVGSHGQTIYHSGAGKRCTLQIGDGSVLAELVGAPVVSDFRPRDMAAGGQGAPLVPYVDYLLLRDWKRGRVALNIGGIANITIIPAGALAEEVYAFDTGPGNMVIDALITEHTQGHKRFDRGGVIGRRGHINDALLAGLLRDPFYGKKPPKSAGREQYGTEFIARLHASGLPAEDLIATATALTARTIADAVRRVAVPVHDVVAAGGGVHNAFLMHLLQAELPDLEVQSSATFGIDPDAKEAIAFAILAHETFHGRPSNMPRATGARHRVILGKISPGPLTV
ncbi:MAG: anhydro-N-acetylmuramic acid kinase [Acidobacteria bacterium]|nr:anhydro-N-acetylmuramic acid kinase [Acidobacteriota bacterium]